MFILMISRGIPSSKHPQWGCFEKDQAEALASIGHKVVVLSIDGRFLFDRRKRGLTHYHINNVDYYNYFLYPQIITDVINHRLSLHINNRIIEYLYKKVVLKHGKPDIIFGQMFMNTLKGIYLSQTQNIPIVGIEHLARFNESHLNSWKYTEKDARYTYENTDATITVSKILQSSLKRHFNVDSYVVPNLVGKEFFYKQKIHNDSFTLITTGSLIERKGFDLLIKALFICNKSLPQNWKTIIIGAGKLRNRLQQLINDYALQDHIVLVGQKNKQEIVQLLQDSDIFVLPSRNETFGVVYLEALACGLPIIATDCGVPPEIVTKENGLFIRKEDINELASAITYIAQNINQYNRKAIAEDCQARYSPEVIAQQLTTIFEETINRHKSNS